MGETSQAGVSVSLRCETAARARELSQKGR